MSISEVVVVNITKETKAVTKKGFGVPLILGNHTKWPGTRQVHTIVFDADLVTGNSVDGSIDGVAITTVPFDTDNATTLTNLAAELQGKADIFTAVSNGTNTITVTTVEYKEVALSGFVVTGGSIQANTTVTETVQQKDEIRSYANIQAVAQDFATSDAEYKKASALFAQEVKPEKVKIGRRRSAIAQVVNVTVPSVADSTEYTVKLNRVEFSFTSGTSATADSIVNGLIAAIGGGSEPVSTTDNGNDFDITADIPGESFDLEVTTNLAFTTTTPNQGMASDIVKAQTTDDDWYFLVITTSLELDILEAAKATESLIKLFFYETNDKNVRDNVTDNIGAKLNAKGYDRTAGIYISDSSSEAEAAWVGGQAPKNPGSITWKFKSLSNVTVDSLTGTDKNNLNTINVNHYTEIGGQNITQEGKVASGEFIDIMRGTDWIQARIEERVYATLVNEDKVPFTNAGIDVIKSKIKQVLLEAVNNGILVDEPERPLNVTAPDILDISSNDKANRLLDNVTFEGFYAGAVHKVKIQGFLSI